MSIPPGTRFGTYEVVESLGSGGMGEVYRARDSTLRRDVALKVLAARHRLDTDRQAQFKREALSLAALNHPNIATVLGVEDAAGVQALVMELVDGRTLDDVIGRRSVPISEALAMARQIVDALDAAHQRGIVHRDLKPSNVKVRPDGVLKVLDFGLAKALAAGSGEEAEASTISVTSAHQVVGTPAYMSPEQARGQAVDHRTDIWAFGCVLYEMLTGRRAFDGATSSDAIAAVLDREPNYDQLPQATPFLVRRLIKRCLEKDPRRRLRDIADARIDLDDAEHADGTAAAGVSSRRSHVVRWWLTAAVAGLVLAAAVSALAVRFSRRSDTVSRPVHMTTLLPTGVTVNRGPGRLLPLAFSPDGRTLVVAASDSKGERLYKRTLDQREATALPGTEGGISPFFSPDGTWVGFIADRRLKRVPIDGGAAIDIAAATAFPAGASWGTDDRIVFAGLRSPLQVVDARGGTPEDLMPRGPGLGASYPDVLPDGRTVLFTEGAWIHALDLVTKHRTDRIIEGVAARYSSNGYLLLNRGTTLLAAPFDAALLKVSGTVLPLLEGVDVERTTNNVAHLAVSRAGAVAFVPTAQTFALMLVDADGRERLLAEHVMLQNPRFSPDGTRLVVAATRNPREISDLWVHDLKTESPAYRLTSDGGRAPVWSRDGASVTYSYPRRNERSGIYSKSADSRGDARRVVAIPAFHWLVGWTPDQTLVYGTMETADDDRMPVSSLYAFSATESRRVVGPGRIWGGRLSRDGRFLAYYAQDSAYFEIYVTPFPATGPKVLIAEGTDPAWSPDGSEIYYRSGSRLMAARVETTSGVRVLSRRLVLEPFLPPLYDDYDIHPDGKTLALVRPAGELRGREISVVLNWPAELERLKSQ
jgi:eukaryotic-like serine/threonine-protein kinase